MHVHRLTQLFQLQEPGDILPRVANQSIKLDLYSDGIVFSQLKRASVQLLLVHPNVQVTFRIAMERKVPNNSNPLDTGELPNEVACKFNRPIMG
jgi:hypothetical protein